MHTNVHPFIHSSIHPSIPFIHPSIHPSIHPASQPASQPSIDPSIRPSVHACMHAYIRSRIHNPYIYGTDLCKYIYTYLPMYTHIYIYIWSPPPPRSTPASSTRFPEVASLHWTLLIYAENTANSGTIVPFAMCMQTVLLQVAGLICGIKSGAESRPQIYDSLRVGEAEMLEGVLVLFM